MRKIQFAEGEYYHVFNRGVEKRNIFRDSKDIRRFLTSIKEFNTAKPIGSLFEQSFKTAKSPELGSLAPKQVDVICYCLNPNHFHLLLRQASEKGISSFMQKLGTGYTNYFNEKYNRSGGLFQGTYKAVHIESNEQLLHTSVYVNLNNRFGAVPNLSASSWDEYEKASKDIFCSTQIITEQFKNSDGYVSFARKTLQTIIEQKSKEKEMLWLLGS